MDKQAYFDVRIILERTGPIAPGQTVRAPIKFLDLQNARGSLAVGSKFLIRDLNFVGEGVIDELCFL
jgi:hypothetical protein